MPPKDMVIVHVRYETLFIAELRAIFREIERAYNHTDCFLRRTRRVHAEDRLTLASAQTGNSIDIHLNGYAQALIVLPFLFHYYLTETKLYWETRKSKWDAKLAETEFRSQENAESSRRISNGIREKDRNLTKALDAVAKLVRRANRSPRIKSIEIHFEPGNSSTIIHTARRRIILRDDK